MRHEEEIDLSQRVPDPAAEIVHHFMKDVDDAAKDYEKPNEAFCAELFAVREQLKELKRREERLLLLIKQYQDRGTFIHGGYSLKITERAGSRTLDKEALLARLEAELGAEEAKVYADACSKQGKPTVTVSVERINLTASSGTVPGGSGERL